MGACDSKERSGPRTTLPLLFKPSTGLTPESTIAIVAVGAVDRLDFTYNGKVYPPDGGALTVRWPSLEPALARDVWLELLCRDIAIIPDDVVGRGAGFDDRWERREHRPAEHGAVGKCAREHRQSQHRQ